MAETSPALQPTVILQDESLRVFEGGFTSIPNRILQNTGLSLGARMSYAMLLKYAWQRDFCFPAQEQIATDLGVTDRSVRTFLNELRGHGLIDWKRQGFHRPNVYYILKLPPETSATGNGASGESTPENSSGPDRKSFPVKTGSLLPVKTGSLLPPKNTHKKNTHNVNVNGLKKPVDNSEPVANRNSEPNQPEPEPFRVRILVEDIVEVTGDRRSRNFYLKLARLLPEGMLRMALGETRTAQLDGRIQKSPGAYFTSYVKQLAREQGFGLGLGPHF